MRKTALRTQTGIASLLYVILIGAAMAALVVGISSSVKSTQDASNALLGQTHAQILSTAGFQGLSSSLTGKTLAEVQSIAGGSISFSDVSVGSSISFVSSPVGTCPINADTTKTNLCFDITAVSKGSSSTVQALFTYSETLSFSSLTGSVFAGGLTVGGSATFTGDTANPVSILIGAEGKVIDTSGKDVDLSVVGINVGRFNGGTFVGPQELKPYANYIFTYSGTTVVCKKNNVGNVTAEIDCDTQDAVGVSYSKNAWKIDPTRTLPGVYWLDGNVNITTQQSKPLVNSIIATGDLNVIQPNGSKGDFNSYSPSYFVNYSSADNSNKILRTCGNLSAQRPSQYCNSDGTLKAPTTVAAAMQNILFLSGGALTLDSGNNTVNNFYGNVIASSSRGGTGSASAKFTGSGNINITGNIISSGTVQGADTDSTRTIMQGNINIDMSNAFTSGSTVPELTYTLQLAGIRYL